MREACQGDSGLCREVSSLLANHSEADDFDPWVPVAAAEMVAERVSLEPGRCLGPYRIDAFLAAGGMGEVYRATDNRLNREVAIKVAGARFSERFEIEARIIASLNHPNICRLYDVGPNYLVMELVEGPTLADLVRRGPLPVAESLRIARQIAEALDAAHEKGRIHRDLKPGNIKITPEGVIKLLDFGLAGSPGETVCEPAILGTPAYMSPEQVQGSAADKRADIWAFGVVLYEMLSGKAAFAGSRVEETLKAVLEAEPDWSALPAATPHRIRKLLRRCLDRDRRQRLRDIGEALIVIDAAGEEPAPARRYPWAWLAAGAIGILLFAGGLVWWSAARSSPARSMMRLTAELGPENALAKGGFQGVLAISPDGRRLAFTARGADGVTRLATRMLDQSSSTLLAGTENAQGPFFSPDGDSIGFFADGKLKRVSVRGTAPVTLCSAPAPRGASWGDDGNIIAALSLGQTRLSRIPASGGTPTPVAEAKGAEEIIYRWPQVLPGSRAVLFNAYQSGKDLEDASIEVLSFQTGERTKVERGYFARYLPSGHLVFVRQNTLFAAPFDLDRLRVTARPEPVLDDISGAAYSGARNFDFARNGTFVYLSGTAGASQVISWLDSNGHLQPLRSELGRYYQPRFSPDGRRLAFTAASGQGMDIWVQDLDRGTASRRSFLPGRSWWPLWTVDAGGIVFSSANGMYCIRADGSVEARPLTGADAQAVPRAFSPDGRLLAFDKGNEIWTAPVEGDSGHPRLGAGARLLDAATPIPEAQFSPNGHWMAYVSAEPGTPEVFVRPFPGPGGKWQISTGGGRFPIWSRNGRELFFLGLDQRIRVAGYSAEGNSFIPGAPHVWSEKRIADLGVNSAYDLAPDGKRFAVIVDAEQTGQSKPVTNVTVLVNFFDELRRRVRPAP